MKKIITTITLLAAMNAPAMADDCIILNARAAGLTSGVTYETQNMAGYTAMMNSAISIGDISTAKMYAGMAKDSIIRLKGNTAQMTMILDDVEKINGKCGLTDAEFADIRNSVNDASKSADAALVAYKDNVK